MSSKEPRGLGKGLSALLGEVPNADQLRKPVGYINKELAGSKSVRNASDILRIPLEMIEPNPFQPRKTFDQDAIEELAESIRTLGLIQPITVRKVAENRFQIISGERRFRASTYAGLDTVPAYVLDTNDKGMLEMAIVENVQRENLDPIEVAMSYQRLMDECSLTQEEMAKRIGKKRTSVTNYLRLLKLPLKAQHDLKAGQLSVGHAKVILGIEDPLVQEKLCDLVIGEDLSVRQLEQRVRSLVSAPSPRGGRKQQPLSEDFVNLGRRLESLAHIEPVLRKNVGGGGSVTIKFQSDAEVRDFLEALGK